jgi:hypothetical protein
MSDTILQRWNLTAEELTQIVDGNPSLRGFMIGYVGEFQLRKIWFSDDRVSQVRKPDDHDRRKKNDLAIVYMGREFGIEVKSLQTLSIRPAEGDTFTGTFQCDASDSRTITLPNGERIKTTCLLVDEFDIVAVNLFAFRKQWDFAFALNRDLPRSTFDRYTPRQRKYLLATSVQVTWPVRPPFVADPFLLLDRLIQEKPRRHRALTKTKK